MYALPSQEIRYTGSDTVSILASLCKCKSDFSTEDEPGQLLYLIREEKPGFSEEAYTERGIEEINSVVCLRPRLNNPRIIRQDGYFFLFGIDRIKDKPAKIPPQWIKEPIIIPAQYKKKILKELESMGYTEGFFYPDFEHYSNIIRRQYGHESAKVTVTG